MKITVSLLLALFVFLHTCYEAHSHPNGGGTVSDSSSSESNSRSPHIIIFLANDFGWNDFNDDTVTPTLLQLASEGHQFTNSYALPLDVGTISALLTCKYPHRTGTQFFMSHFPRQGYGLPSSFTLLPEKLKELGYKTHALGKWKLGFCHEDYLPTNRGFDTFYGTYTGNVDYYEKTSEDPQTGDEGYDFYDNDALVTPRDSEHLALKIKKRAVDIIEDFNPKENPLFMYYSFQLPGAPLQAPTKYLDRFASETNPERRKFLALSNMMDEAVKEVKKALKKKKMLDDTFILFLSGNGGDVLHGGNNIPYRGNKGTVYEGGMRVPTFVWGNMLNTEVKGSVSDGMIHAIDWFPTILKMVNNVSDIECNGKDQSDMVFNGGDSKHNLLFLALDDIGASKAAVRSNCLFTDCGGLGILNGRDFKFIDGEPSYLYPVRINSETNSIFPVGTTPLITTYNVTLPGETTPQPNPADGDGVPLSLLFDLEVDTSESSDIDNLTIVQLILQRMLRTERTHSVGSPFIYDVNNLLPAGNPEANSNTAWISGWCDAVVDP